MVTSLWSLLHEEAEAGVCLKEVNHLLVLCIVLRFEGRAELYRDSLDESHCFLLSLLPCGIQGGIDLLVVILRPLS